jgi:hypothetical protein
VRAQELVAPAGAVGFVAAAPVTGTQELWQFMASVSQPLVQVVNVDPDGSNWGVGRGIGTTTPVPSGGSGDCICDRSGATPGDTGVDGGDGTVICGCWASALPVSKAIPSAAIADNLIVMFIMLPPVGDFRAAFPFPDTTQGMGRN